VASFLVVNTPTGVTTSWDPPEPPAAARSAASAFARDVSAARVPMPTPDDSDATVFLRLNLRRSSPDQVAADVSDHVVDLEFGPMGAPPSYPRVSVNELFRHAAERA